MQLAKVVIASVLVLAACAEGLPEGKSCVLKYVNISHFVPWLLSTITNCSVLTSVRDKSFSSSSQQKVSVKYFYLLPYTTEDTHITGGQTYCKCV